MAVILKRTNSADADFRILVKLLDAELSERDGPDHAFYDQFNKIDQLRHVVVAYWEGKPAGCGAIKAYAPGTAEVKRMFVKAEFRKRGYATTILKALESWAITLDYSTLILETGIAQPEAIGLYQRNGYIIMPNYGQYEGVENSVCMKKALP